MSEGREVCLVDFNGYTRRGHYETSYWADWYEGRQAVVFGGDWQDIPDMEAVTEPPLTEIESWGTTAHGH